MRQAFLEIEAPAPKRHQIPETPNETLIGRSSECQITVSEASVSRRHARIIRTGDDYEIEDLGSANGTMVAGVRITAPTPLTGGVEVVFGKVQARFVQETAHETIVPAVIEEQVQEDLSVPPDTAMPVIESEKIPEPEKVPEPKRDLIPDAEPVPESTPVPKAENKESTPRASETRSAPVSDSKASGESSTPPAETASQAATRQRQHEPDGSMPTLRRKAPIEIPEWGKLAAIFVVSFLSVVGIGWLLRSIFG